MFVFIFVFFIFFLLACLDLGQYLKEIDILTKCGNLSVWYNVFYISKIMNAFKRYKNEVIYQVLFQLQSPSSTVKFQRDNQMLRLIGVVNKTVFIFLFNQFSFHCSLMACTRFDSADTNFSCLSFQKESRSSELFTCYV